MLVDTDVVVWSLRGLPRAERRLQSLDGFALSAISYMELVQGMRDARELAALRRALRFWSADVVAVSPEISSRGMFLLEQHALGDGLRLADALIAATAMVQGDTLLTANRKHYAPLRGLAVEVFQPAALSV